MQYRNLFTRQSRELRNKAKQLRQLHQIAKGGGLAVTLLSGLGLVASAGTALPLIIGSIIYGSSVLSENKRTGKLKLIPFLEDDLTTIAARSMHEETPQTLGTQAHHYLEPEDKALYYLVNFQGHRLTQMAEELEPDQFEHVLVNLIDHLVTAHQPALNHPELLGSALGINFFDDALDSLPSELGDSIPVDRALPSQPFEDESVGFRRDVGRDTRLNALETSYSVSDEPAPVSVQKATTTALSTILASPYTSRAIFGAQRTGKSYLAAVASQKLSDKGTSIFHLNLSSFGDEDARYWGHTKRSVRGDLTAVDPAKAINLIRDAIALVNEWWSTRNSILIADEWGHLGSSSNAYKNELTVLLKLIADKISCVASTGIKRQQAIWTISPEFVAGSMEQDAKAIKKLQVCLLAIPKGKFVDWNGSKITWNDELYDQVSKNFTVKPYQYNGHLASHERVAYLNGMWVPVGLAGAELKRISQAPIQSENVTETAPLGKRILDYMRKVNKPLAAWEIRNGCTQSKALNREGTEQVKDALCLLASEGKVKRIEDGKKEIWTLQ